MKIKFVRTAFIILVLGMLNPAGRAVFGQGVTFTTNNYTTGNNPYSVIAADVFGSGRPAIITANQSDSTLTVLGNLGNGSFFTNATCNVGSPPNCVVAADIDGDGRLDLISVGSNTTVLTNNGSGGFGSNATVNVGGFCAVTVDLKGSGRPDLLVGNGTSVFICTNNGSGRFVSGTVLSVPGMVYSMAVSDVNLDGKPDLIVANYTYGSLTVFTNAGGGWLVSNATYAVGSDVRSVIAADVNGDGYVDLISGSAFGYPNSTLSILTNDGSGTFGSNATVTVARGTCSVVAADFNGDGLTDLIAMDSLDRPGIVSVVTNSSAGWGTYFTITAGTEPQAMAMADFNDDGRPDLVLGNTGNTVTVLLNTTVFASPPLNILSAGNQSVLYWRSPAPNSVLQSTTNLLNPNWVTVSNGTPIMGVTLPTASPTVFYRLKSQ